MKTEKYGHWIFKCKWQGYQKYYCSECNPINDVAVPAKRLLPLECPFCKAKMSYEVKIYAGKEEQEN